MDKKLLLCITVLLFSITLFSQEMPDTTVVSPSKSTPLVVKNELRFNLATLIEGAPELTYERLIADNMGCGLSAMVFLDDSENMAGSSLIIPYYRVYFGKEKAAGFFIEGNMAMLRLRETDLYGDLYSSDSGFFHSHSSATYNSYFGFGAAVGVKLLTKNNLVGELVFGIGRLYNRYDDGAYPRIGLCLGKRF